MLIEQFQGDRLQRGNKPAMPNRLVTTLKHMFTKAVDWNMAEEDILKRIRKVKLLEENNKRLRFLSAEECEALVNAAESHLRPIILTAVNTGMRIGEILSLQWNNVDFNHGFILQKMVSAGRFPLTRH
jgi:integrase